MLGLLYKAEWTRGLTDSRTGRGSVRACAFYAAGVLPRAGQYLWLAGCSATTMSKNDVIDLTLDSDTDTDVSQSSFESLFEDSSDHDGCTSSKRLK